MKKGAFVITILLLLSSTVPSVAQPINNGILYFSAYESDRFRFQQWLTPGEYIGNIHTNGRFGFRFPPVSVTGYLSSGGDGFRFWQGFDPEDLELRYEPCFEISLPFPLGRDVMYQLRGAASPFLFSHNGQFVTWIKMFGDEGIDIYQYRKGTPPRDSLIFRLPPPLWQTIFVDGDVVVEGELSGYLTIGCAGDMYLSDDVRYVGADRFGRFAGWVNAMLGLASERDIIIADTEPNGCRNGYREHPNDMRRHSIVIDAGLYIPNGSLRFQHPNEEWDAYQGPEPDLRGVVYLTGQVTQQRGYPLFNSNHGGTGYRASFQYDERFDFRPPPNITLIIGFIFGRRYDSFYLHGTVNVVGNADYVRIYGYPESSLIFLDAYTLWMRDLLQLNGSGERPIHISRRDGEAPVPPAVLRMCGGVRPRAIFSNVLVGRGVITELEADTIRIDSCRFAGEVVLRGDYVEVNRSTFEARVRLDGWGDVTFTRNLFEGGLVIGGNPRTCAVINNTVVNPGGDGIRLETFRGVELTGNIVAFCRRGIVNDHWRFADPRFGDVYGSETADYSNCRPGEGSISRDPLFVDRQSCDFHLAWGSPCIDAGDPNAPPDPDGSRADMGAFPFHHLLDSPSESPPVAAGFFLSAAPNPFNLEVEISLKTDRCGGGHLSIYDIRGRCVIRRSVEMGAERSAMTVAGSALGGPGVYFARLEFGGQAKTLKLVYLP